MNIAFNIANLERLFRAKTSSLNSMYNELNLNNESLFVRRYLYIKAIKRGIEDYLK